ncbi:hypothetical protein QJS10_CPB12g01316 [Acorus calamus]|uniref:Uncharacterized protein n=1 Tax=Acorus calamus TaxID=4465 RepID=A0AAV9DNB3_ACOCL|nr:hypothetical protein QJS10_CPB12g01316 [Acorus calamus]
MGGWGPATWRVFIGCHRDDTPQTIPSPKVALDFIVASNGNNAEVVDQTKLFTTSKPARKSAGLFPSRWIWEILHSLALSRLALKSLSKRVAVQGGLPRPKIQAIAILESDSNQILVNPNKRA